jgi:CRP-like cAMP-binding protein
MSPEFEQVELGRIERIHALRSLFGPTGPSTTALAALAAVSLAVRIPRGRQIMREGEPSDAVFIIVEGELVAEGRGKLLGRYGPRNVLGSLAALARDPRGLHCHASQDTVALQLRADDMLEVFEDHFELLQAVMEALARGSIEIRRNLKPHGGYDRELSPDPELPTEALDLVERMLSLRRTLAMHTHIDELAELARAAQEVHYPKDAPLWFEAEAAVNMLIVVRGSVRAHTSDGLAFRFGPGDLVGGLDTLAGTERWYDAVAERHVIALSLERDTILDLCEDQAELGFDFLRLLAAMLLALRERTAPDAAEQVVIGT